MHVVVRIPIEWRQVQLWLACLSWRERGGMAEVCAHSPFGPCTHSQLPSPRARNRSARASRPRTHTLTNALATSSWDAVTLAACVALPTSLNQA